MEGLLDFVDEIVDLRGVCTICDAPNVSVCSACGASCQTGLQYDSSGACGSCSYVEKDIGGNGGGGCNCNLSCTGTCSAKCANNCDDTCKGTCSNTCKGVNKK